MLSRPQTMSDQPQQHGVGGVEQEAWIERLVVEHRSALADVARLQAQVAQYENGIMWQTTCLRCAETIDNCAAAQLAVLAQRDDLRARCASLEAALREIHDDSQLHRALNPRCSICAALDQIATTTQEGTHG